MTEERKRAEPGDSFREGVRAVTGILGALRDAVEGTFDDLSAKGDMNPDRAKEAARDTMNRAQEAMDKVRDRLDFVTRTEYEALRAEVAELRRRVDLHEAARHTGAPGSSSMGGSFDSGTTGQGDGSPGL